MKTKTNGVLNFLYRIFIDVEEKDEEPLKETSTDSVEVALAKSQESLDEKWDSHFTSNSGKGKGKFKVEESQLNKDEKAEKDSKEAVKEVSQEEKEDYTR